MADVLDFKKKEKENTGTVKTYPVKIFKLITREELIAFWEHDEKNKTSTLHNPLMIIIQPVMDQGGRTNMNMSFVAYMPYTKKSEFLVDDFQILHVVDPADDLEKQFRSHFSGLVMPASPKLIV